MNFIEIGNRAMDLVLGPRIDGTVIGVLPDFVSPDDISFSRYVVEDQNERLLEIRVSKVSGINFGLAPAIGIENPNPSRGQTIKVRAASVEPWADGNR